LHSSPAMRPRSWALIRARVRSRWVRTSASCCRSKARWFDPQGDLHETDYTLLAGLADRKFLPQDRRHDPQPPGSLRMWRWLSVERQSERFPVVDPRDRALSSVMTIAFARVGASALLRSRTTTPRACTGGAGCMIKAASAAKRRRITTWKPRSTPNIKAPGIRDVGKARSPAPPTAALAR
jgi:hypothetical protein